MVECSHTDSLIWFSRAVAVCSSFILLCTSALHSSLSHKVILPCSTDISLPFNTVFMLSNQTICVLPFNLTSLTLDLQAVLLHFLHLFRPPQHIALPNQLTRNTSFSLHLLFPHSVLMYYSTHILLTHLIFITFNLLFSVTTVLHISSPYSALASPYG